MLGIKELAIGLCLIGLVAFFGRKTIIKLAKDFFSIKKDIKDISEGKNVEVK